VTVGSPVSAAPMGNPNQQQVDNLLVLATNAFEASNNAEAESYCNRVIELDVTCYKAWLLKGQAIGWQSTYGKPRVEEGANAMRKAVDFAPEEEKENIARTALLAIQRICIALHDLAKQNFGNSPTEDNREKFLEFGKICADATDLFNDVSEDIKAFSFDVWKEQRKKMAEYMNLAGVAAVGFIREKWNDLDHPNTDSLTTYLDWFGEVDIIFRQSIENGLATDEADEEIITRYENLIISLEDPMEACSWKHEWSSWSSSYVWEKDQFLSASAKANRRKEVRECKDKIQQIKNKAKEAEEAAKRAAEEAKQERIKAYWEAHKEEKETLEAEKKQLEDKKKDINAQIADLDKQIRAEEAKEKEKVPAEAEKDKIRDQLGDLNIRRANLGIFSGKEKKQISEEIAALEGRATALNAKIQEEKKAQSEEIKKVVAPWKAKKDELNKELPAITKRISAIEAELTKDPEE